MNPIDSLRNHSGDSRIICLYLNKINSVQKTLQEDMLLLHKHNPKNFLLIEVLTILVPSLPSSSAPSLMTIGLSSSNVKDTRFNLLS